jgi:hypothetical protein
MKNKLYLPQSLNNPFQTKIHGLVFMFMIISVLILPRQLKAQNSEMDEGDIHEILGQLVIHKKVGHQKKTSCGFHSLKNALAMLNFFQGDMSAQVARDWIFTTDGDDLFEANFKGTFEGSCPTKKSWKNFAANSQRLIDVDSIHELVNNMKAGSVNFMPGPNCSGIYDFSAPTYTKVTGDFLDRDRKTLDEVLAQLKKGEKVALMVDDIDLLRKDITHAFSIVIVPIDQDKRKYYLMDSLNYSFDEFFGKKSVAQMMISMIETALKKPSEE